MNLRLNSDFSIRLASWPEDAPALRAVRHAVFVVEQGVPAELEWDAADAEARHVLAIDAAGLPIGTARLLVGGHIGRMAVLGDWRHRGVGSAMLQVLLQTARSAGLQRVDLHAQTHATGFYAKHGFRPEGAEFTEAGIPHRRMVFDWE